MCFKRINWEKEYDTLLIKYQELNIKHNALELAFLSLSIGIDKILDVIERILEKYGD